MPPKVYFKGGCLETALGDLKAKRKAFIVTGESSLVTSASMCHLLVRPSIRDGSWQGIEHAPGWAGGHMRAQLVRQQGPREGCRPPGLEPLAAE